MYEFTDEELAAHDAELRESVVRELLALPTTRTRAWDRGWDSISLQDALNAARGKE